MEFSLFPGNARKSRNARGSEVTKHLCTDVRRARYKWSVRGTLRAELFILFFLWLVRFLKAARQCQSRGSLLRESGLLRVLMSGVFSSANVVFFAIRWRLAFVQIVRVVLTGFDDWSLSICYAEFVDYLERWIIARYIIQRQRSISRIIRVWSNNRVSYLWYILSKNDVLIDHDFYNSDTSFS